MFVDDSLRNSYKSSFLKIFKNFEFSYYKSYNHFFNKSYEFKINNLSRTSGCTGLYISSKQYNIVAHEDFHFQKEVQIDDHYLYSLNVILFYVLR